MTYYQRETLTARAAQRGILATIKSFSEDITGTTDCIATLRDYCELYLEAAENEQFYGKKWAEEIAEKEAAKAETEVNE